MPGKLKWGGGPLKRGVLCHGMEGYNVSFAIVLILSILHRILWHTALGSRQLYLLCGVGWGHKVHSWCDQGGLGSTCLARGRHWSFTLLEDIPMDCVLSCSPSIALHTAHAPCL